MLGTIFAPPTRRELTLALFGFSVFVLSYNLESSLHSTGFATLSRLSSTSVSLDFDADARRPIGWRDQIEDLLSGKWDWAPGAVADGPGLPPVGEGARFAEGAILSQEFNATYEQGAPIENEAIRDRLRGWGVESLGKEVVNWKDGIEKTTVVQHIPGEAGFAASRQHIVTAKLSNQVSLSWTR
jgi:hypothetical protein